MQIVFTQNLTFKVVLFFCMALGLGKFQFLLVHPTHELVDIRVEGFFWRKNGVLDMLCQIVL